MKLSYRHLQVTETAPGKYTSSVIQSEMDGPKGDNVLIRVHYSSLNYKDALSASGNKGVTRNYPHTPGIDASGVVEASATTDWQEGDKVIVTGFDLGMNTNGGFAEYICVPKDWLVRLPEQMTLRTSMIYGTAGFTAGLSVAALFRNGITPESGKIIVSGATGGVGSISVAILSKLGYHVTAVTGKPDAIAFLRGLGASEIISREEMEDESGKTLLQPRFAAGIDTVGGKVLATIIKSLGYGGIVTACGMVNGGEIPVTVFPFILKGIQLIGIDSVQYPLDKRTAVWKNLASDWLPENLESLTHEIELEDLPEFTSRMLNAGMHGRAIVRLISS